VRIAHPQLVDNIVLNFLCSGRRQCEDRGTAKAFGDRAEGQIVRAEVVPPLAHAMGFIDHEETDFPAKKMLEEPAILESFRCEIEKLALTRLNLPVRFAALVSRKVRMHGDGIDALG
jgi:hypothetical protein